MTLLLNAVRMVRVLIKPRVTLSNAMKQGSVRTANVNRNAKLISAKPVMGKETVFLAAVISAKSAYRRLPADRPRIRARRRRSLVKPQSQIR